MIEKEIILMKGVKELTHFLIIQYASKSSSYSDLHGPANVSDRSC